MAIALPALVAWHLIHHSASARLFDSRLFWSLLWAAIATFAVGALAAFVVCFCHGRRLVQGALAVTALLLGATCLGFGAFSMAQASSRATSIRRFCLEARIADQRSAAQAASQASFGGAGAREADEREGQAAQQAYEILLDALTVCRQEQPNALQLEACPDAKGSRGQQWTSIAHADLFQQAEEQYRCGGFCLDGPPLFGLPVGTVDVWNKGRLRRPCFRPLLGEALQRASVAGWALLLLSLPLLATACGLGWLACAPPPRLRGNYAHRPEELEWRNWPQDPEASNGDEHEQLLQDM